MVEAGELFKCDVLAGGQFNRPNASTWTPCGICWCFKICVWVRCRSLRKRKCLPYICIFVTLIDIGSLAITVREQIAITIWVIYAKSLQHIDNLLDAVMNGQRVYVLVSQSSHIQWRILIQTETFDLIVWCTLLHIVF